MARTIDAWMSDLTPLWRTLPMTIIPRLTGVLSALFKKPNLRSKTTDIPLKAEVKSMIDASMPTREEREVAGRPEDAEQDRVLVAGRTASLGDEGPEVERLAEDAQPDDRLDERDEQLVWVRVPLPQVPVGERPQAVKRAGVHLGDGPHRHLLGSAQRLWEGVRCVFLHGRPLDRRRPSTLGPRPLHRHALAEHLPTCWSPPPLCSSP